MGALAGVGTVMAFLLRRDRVKLPAWVGAFALFVLYLCSALPAAYPEDDLADVVALFGDPAGRMLIGPGYGLADPSYARLITNGYGLYLMLLAALMSILLVVRHTRAEERSGRADLVRAHPVGRHAPLAATMLVAAITDVAAGLMVAIVLVAFGYGAVGSLLLAASVTATGLAFAGVAAVTAQLTESPRAAAGSAGAVLGAAFVVRAAGDMTRPGGTAVSWLSPLAWGQQTAPFVLDRWWPLALALALALAGTGAGFVLSARRDVGAGLVPARPGPARADPTLATPLGLALRLGRAGIIGWAAALAVTGLVLGMFADAMRDSLTDLPEVFEELFGSDDLLAGYFSFMARYMAYFVAAYAVQAVQGLRGEETGGRADPVLATPVGRRAWLGSTVTITTAGVVVISAAIGVFTGLGAALAVGEVGRVGELTVAHLAHVPAVLVVLGIAALAFGAAPRLLPASWVLVAYALIAGTFGELLGLPRWVLLLSPFEHSAEVPLEPFEPVAALVLTGVAAGLAGLALAALARRDIENT